MDDMDTASLIAAAALFWLLATTVIAIVLAIYRNLKTGRRFRQHLAARVDSLRLSKMLGVLGIDREQYTHKLPVVDIEQHMAKCDACTTKQTCDEVLPDANPDTNLDFCPNQESLRRSSL
jgi:hypothetical protein